MKTKKKLITVFCVIGIGNILLMFQGMFKFKVEEKTTLELFGEEAVSAKIKTLEETVKHLIRETKQNKDKESSENSEKARLKREKNSAEVCRMYTKDAKRVRTRATSIWRDHVDFRFEDITMVLQLTLDRLSILELHAEYWSGPLSATLYIKRSHLKKLVERLKQLKLVLERNNIDIHIVIEAGVFHPVNTLRNVALWNVRTKYVFYNDVDFITNREAHVRLRAHIEQGALNGKRVLVVPALEFVSGKHSMPEEVEKVKELIQENTLAPFHQQTVKGRHFNPSHGGTNTTKWSQTDQVYKATWTGMYEPYFIGEKDLLPMYDERFVGRGLNKLAHTFKIHAQGFEFQVVPDVFLIHYPHKKNYSADYRWISYRCSDIIYQEVVKKYSTALAQNPQPVVKETEAKLPDVRPSERPVRPPSGKTLTTRPLRLSPSARPTRLSPPPEAPLRPPALNSSGGPLYLYRRGGARLGNQLYWFASTYGIAKWYGRRNLWGAPMKNGLVDLFPGIEATMTFDDNVTWPNMPTNRRNYDPSVMTSLPDVNLTISHTTHSYKYFQHCQEDIYRLMQLDKTMVLKANTFISQVKKEHLKNDSHIAAEKLQVVGIHIRRGDKLSEKNQGKDYGYRIPPSRDIHYAMNYLRHKHKHNVIFIIATDDKKWCREKLQKKPDVFISPFRSAVDDFVLLASGDHLIMTQSSFAWWAAWLLEQRVIHHQREPPLTAVKPDILFNKRPFIDGTRLGRNYIREYLYPAHWIAYTDHSVDTQNEKLCYGTKIEKCFER